MGSKRHSLILYFIFSIGGVFIALYAFQFFYITSKVSSATRLDYERNIEELTATHSKSLERKFKEYRRELRMYTENEIIKSGDFEASAEWLKSMIPLRDKSYTNILIVDKNGNYISDDGKSKGSVRDRPYFDALFNKGEEYAFDDPIVTSDGKLMLHVARVVKQDKKPVAIVVVVIGAHDLQRQVEKDVLGDHGYAWLMSSDGTIVSHPNKDWELKKNFAKNPEPGYEDLTQMVKRALAKEEGHAWVKGKNGGKDLVCFLPVEETPWVYAFTVEAEQVNATGNELRLMMIITSGIVCAVILVLLGLVTANALRPLRVVETNINEIASGKADLTNRIKINSQNEIGSVVNGFNRFTEKLQAIISEIKISNGDLTEVGESMKSSSEKTVEAITYIQSNIDSVHNQIISQSEKVEETAGAVNEVASNIEALEKMIDTQASEVIEASKAVEVMIENLNSVGNVVGRISDAFIDLLAKSEAGSLKQNDVNQRIEQIKVQSNTLGEANKSIENIASQTNLLAMNAAIEAAHAGEAGKGFSVVADEIRKLSETSSQQSKTIGNQLKSIQESIDSVVQASSESSQAFMVVSREIKSTDDLIRQIEFSVKDQKDRSSLITKALGSMNDRTLEVKTASNEMNEGNKTILGEVRDLQNITSTIKSNMAEMKDAAEKVYDTGAKLSEISNQVKTSIDRTGNQIDQFTV